MPDVRQRGRQKTCGKECRKENHRKQCARWNKKNRAYHKANYLSMKLEEAKRPPPKDSQVAVVMRNKRQLPRDVIRDAIGNEFLVILEYVLEHVYRKNRQGSGGKHNAKWREYG